MQGYFWDFPAYVGGRPSYNRGIYAARVASERRRAHLPALLQTSLDTLGVSPRAYQPAGYPIHCFSPQNHFAAPNLLLVGEATGVDPLFGEGIAPALGYGEVAAQAVQNAFATDDYAFDFSNQSWFVHAIWTLGKVLAALWPKHGKTSNLAHQ